MLLQNPEDVSSFTHKETLLIDEELRESLDSYH